MKRRAPDALLVGCICTQGEKIKNNAPKRKKDKPLRLASVVRINLHILISQIASPSGRFGVADVEFH